MVEVNRGIPLVTLYARILRALDDNPCLPLESLARNLEVTVKTVQRHAEALERAGALHVDRDVRPFKRIVTHSFFDRHEPISCHRLMSSSDAGDWKADECFALTVA